MKEIKAYVRQSRIDPVIHALKNIGVDAVTVIPVDGIGGLADPVRSHLSTEYVTDFSRLYKLEIVCRARHVQRIVDCICESARTGDPGDGAVFVSSVERAVKIRTGADGQPALHAMDGASSPEGGP